MPVETPIRANLPVSLETVPKIGVYRGDGDSPNFHNYTGETIVPGEPVELGDKIGISKTVIYPGEVGTLDTNYVADFKLDPNYSGNIYQGTKMYFDYDLDDSDNPIGYATPVEPSNGYVIGYAVVTPATKVELETYGNKAIVAQTGDTHVRVMSTQKDMVKFGTTPFTANP